MNSIIVAIEKYKTGQLKFSTAHISKLMPQLNHVPYTKLNHGSNPSNCPFSGMDIIIIFIENPVRTYV